MGKQVPEAYRTDQDAKWDGLKGYITKSGMDKQQLVANYKELWQIEKVF